MYASSVECKEPYPLSVAALVTCRWPFLPGSASFLPGSASFSARFSQLFCQVLPAFLPASAATA